MFGPRSQPDTGNEKVSRSPAEAFAELYEQFMPKVFKYVSYRVSDTHVAEDLTSTVFEKALTKFKTYDARKAAFSTWIFSIARNALIDHYRTTGREQTVELDHASSVPSGNPSPDDELVRLEEFRRLRHCLSKLSQHEQEIVSLKFGAEMNNRQIAGTLGLGESNIGTIIYRAVGKLRDCFKRWQNGR